MRNLPIWLTVIMLILASAVLGGLLFLAAINMFPFFALNYSYDGLKSLIYDDLGVTSDALAEFLARAGSFIMAVIWLPTAVYAFKVTNPFRKLRLDVFLIAFVLWMVTYGTSPLLRAMYGGNVCFSQTSGKALKWYTFKPDGMVVLRDSGGFEPNGTQRKKATAEICRIEASQREGILPHKVTGNPEDIAFFNTLSGAPLIWTATDENGRITLYDAMGVDPHTGDPLDEITKQAVRAVFDQWESDEAARLRAIEDERRRAEEAAAKEEAERQARLEKERREAAIKLKEQQEAEEQARKVRQAALLCDQLAANPLDPRKSASVTGVSYAFVAANAQSAIQACQLAIQANPNSLTLQYELGRAMQATRDPSAQSVMLDLTRRGYPAAFDNLGWIYFNQGNVKAAIGMFESGAAAGSSEAMFSLFQLYAEGKWIEKDETKALTHLRQAANLGHPEAAQVLSEYEKKLRQQEQAGEVIKDLFLIVLGGMAKNQ